MSYEPREGLADALIDPLDQLARKIGAEWAVSHFGYSDAEAAFLLADFKALDHEADAGHACIASHLAHNIAQHVLAKDPFAQWLGRSEADQMTDAWYKTRIADRTFHRRILFAPLRGERVVYRDGDSVMFDPITKDAPGTDQDVALFKDLCADNDRKSAQLIDPDNHFAALTPSEP
jgi:hypothetical protein